MERNLFVNLTIEEEIWDPSDLKQLSMLWPAETANFYIF